MWCVLWEIWAKLLYIIESFSIFDFPSYYRLCLLLSSVLVLLFCWYLPLIYMSFIIIQNFLTWLQCFILIMELSNITSKYCHIIVSKLCFTWLLWCNLLYLTCVAKNTLIQTSVTLCQESEDHPFRLLISVIREAMLLDWFTLVWHLNVIL